MLLILFLLFTVVPTVEIFTLWTLFKSDTFGWGGTILLVLFTGIVGVSLAKWQGLATLQKIQQQIAAKEPPTDTLIDGAMILVAGIVLITPGLLTDLFGFALLIPPVRAVLKPLLAAWFKRRMHATTAGGTTVHVWSSMPRSGQNAPGTLRDDAEGVIEAEVIEVRTKDAD